MAQYIAFWALYNAYFPVNLLKFLHYLLLWTVTWHKEVFKGWAEWRHDDDEDFVNNWKNNEHRRFYEEDLYNHFIIQFGFILLLQLVVLIIGLIIYFIYSGKKKSLLPENFQSLPEADKH